MIMKKYFLSLGLIAAAAVTLTNCTKEIDQPDQAPESAGFPFEITASTAVTKTVAGDDYATNWANNDALSVFHAVAGSTEYGANDEFTITAENLASNRFTGNLTEALDASKKYDWYVLYPYKAYKTPANTNSGVVYLGSKYNEVQTQTGYDSYSHLAGPNFPLYGKSKNTPATETPGIAMSHLTSALKLTVTNTTSEPLTINQVSFTAPDDIDIIGSYYISYAGEEVIYTPNSTYVNKTATLNVKEGTSLDNGESATFYIGFKPFAAKSGDVLKMSVNGYEKELTLTKTVTFAAGHIKAMTFDYNQVMELKTVSLPWKEDFGTIGTPSDLSNYTLVNASVKTDAGYAGGLLPELMISKDGYLSVNVDLGDESGDMTLSFKSNNAEEWSITTSTNDVEITEPETTGIYYINVPEGTDVLQLTLTNTKSGNNRIDDISLSVGRKSAQTLEFDKNEVSVTFGDDFTRPVLSGAVTTVTYSSSVPTVATVNSSSGEVSIVGAGTTVITATAAETNEYFGASASYTLTVVEASTLYVFKTQKSGSNTAYATNYDVTIDNVSWNVPGNQNFDGYVRIGGKNLENVTRVIYSKGSVAGDVKSVVMETNGISHTSLTVHSVVCKVYSSAAGAAAGDDTDLIATISNTDDDWVKSPKTISFVNSSAAWSNYYYRFEFTVSNSTGTNYGIDLCKIEFKSN